MTFRCVRIDADGTATALDEGQSSLDHARDLFDGDVEVVSLTRMPGSGWEHVGPDVGFVHGTGVFRFEAGEDEFRLNVKGWGLYGRSPIFGPLIVAHDDGRDLDPQVLDWVQRATWTEMMAAGGYPNEIIAAAQSMMGQIAAREYGLVMVPGL